MCLPNARIVPVSIVMLFKSAGSADPMWQTMRIKMLGG
jgi:hypothetical protein